MAEDAREERVAADGHPGCEAQDGSQLSNKMLDEGSGLLGRMEICIAEAEKRSGKNAMSMQETFTVYLIETRLTDAAADGRSPAPNFLWRRYSEFELLRSYLTVTYPYIVVPPLPEKRAEFVWHKLSADNMDPDFVERRRVGLENFLLRVALHPVLSDDRILHRFLTEEHGWKEVVCDTGFQAKADSRLRALNASFRVRNPEKCFLEMKHYSDQLQSNTAQLLRARARVADRLYGVYKVHGNYGRVFSEWSAIEKEMGDGLQSAGHHMDAYAASIDDILEEEEHYADQIKEYLFYSEALRAVCRKHELTQFELEMSSQDLVCKKQQREELATGIVRTFSLKGMTHKLFGHEAPEQKEARLRLLEEMIEEGEETVRVKTAEWREHVDKACEEMRRFKEQTDRDLREALVNYAVMQISMCKKGIQVWSNTKECFLKM
ncbi:sorting nexin-4-like isoform X2 [Takifugu rubripes]|uniref:sorting nexin-4-like isoform X2 n=1 Tax=Takifugu rubripes TaxID=31033 RepID=UPI0011457B43|nr:sorting nexin-4-like isoform X2 [Takifugu rubripes]